LTSHEGSKRAKVWLHQERDEHAAKEFRDMLLQEASALNTVSALLLTIAAAGLLLTPAEFDSNNTDSENDVLHWLYVVITFASFCTALLSLLTGTEKYLALLGLHPSRV
jgi:hypothetical protein